MYFRMKNIQMNLNNFLLRVENFDRILSYKYWTSLVLFEINSRPSSNITVIARLLDKLPSLKKFKLCLMMETEEDMLDIQSINILFPALVKSQLSNIHIEIPNFTNSTDACVSNICSSKNTSLVNYTVRHLSIIQSSNSNSQFSSLFVKHFLGVFELYVKLGNPNIIFQHQVSRRKLYFRFNDFSHTHNSSEP